MDELLKFLMYYNLYRRHASLRKELNVKTPFDAIKKWFKINPEIFKENPLQFKNKKFFCTILIQVIINKLVKLDIYLIKLFYFGKNNNDFDSRNARKI